MNKKLRNVPFYNSMTAKTLLLNAAVFSCFFIIILYTMYLPMRQMLLSQAQEEQRQVLDRLTDSLDTNLGNALNFTSVLYYNTPYVEMMIEDYENDINSLENYLMSIASVGDYIFAINLRTSEKSYYVYQSTRRYTVVQDMPDNYAYWAQTLRDANGSPRILTVSTGNIKSAGNCYATIGRMLYGHNGQELGVVLLDVDIQTPFNYYTGSFLGNPYVGRPDTGAYGSFLLTDENNNILYQTDNSQFDFTDGIIATRDGEFLYDDERYLVLSSALQSADWSIYYYMPESLLLSELSQFTANMISATAVAFLGCMVVLILYIRSFTRRLRILADNVSAFRQGQLSVALKDERKDEIALLVRGFNDMTSEIDALIHQVYALQIKQKEAAFNALKAQIDPHFINNTLQNIQMMAVLRDEQEIASQISDLGLLLRRNMDTKTDYVTVGQEMEFVRAYAALMQMRFSDGFDCTVHIDEGVADRQMLRFLVQPIVENAITHGIWPLAEQQPASTHAHAEACRKGVICVHAWTQNGSLFISVEDNGIGMTTEKLQSVIRLLDERDAINAEDSHIGLQNVHARIRLAYGNAYGIRIRSTPGQGAAVTIEIPLMHNAARVD